MYYSSANRIPSVNKNMLNLVDTAVTANVYLLNNSIYESWFLEKLKISALQKLHVNFLKNLIKHYQ